MIVLPALLRSSRSLLRVRSPSSLPLVLPSVPSVFVVTSRSLVTSLSVVSVLTRSLLPLFASRMVSSPTLVSLRPVTSVSVSTSTSTSVSSMTPLSVFTVWTSSLSSVAPVSVSARRRERLPVSVFSTVLPSRMLRSGSSVTSRMLVSSKCPQLTSF